MEAYNALFRNMKYLLFALLFLVSPVVTHAGVVNDPVYYAVDAGHFTCENNETWFEVVGVNVPDTCGSEFSISDAVGTHQVIFYSGDCNERLAGCSGVTDTGVVEDTVSFEVVYQREYTRTPNDYTVPVGTDMNISLLYNYNDFNSNLAYCMQISGTCYHGLALSGVEAGGFSDILLNCEQATLDGNGYTTITSGGFSVDAGGVEAVILYI